MGENFNENLKRAREQKGMSQKDVSEKIGVAKSTYSLYESGNREPNVHTIKKISDVLDISADELLGIRPYQPTLAILEYRRADEIAKAMVLRALSIDEIVSKGESARMA